MFEAYEYVTIHQHLVDRYKTWKKEVPDNDAGIMVLCEAISLLHMELIRAVAEPPKAGK